jgi:hypothetical protein
MKKSADGAHVHPFPVRHSGSELNSVFTQESRFSRDDRGRLVAPFSCFPPFRGEMPFVVARGRIVLADETARRVASVGDQSEMEEQLAEAIKRKLPTTSNGGELVIEPDDLPADVPAKRK